ncbi:MAG: hypothetical protein Q8O11_07975, partial [Syntrophales bacterium]|nr:hypothetical protein [Syntrophales bacterium]
MGFVEFEILVFCNDGDFPADCLSDDEPVEGIAMADQRELVKCRDVLRIDPQDLQIHRFRDGGKLHRRNIFQAQFAERIFQRNLPEGDETDQDRMLSVRDERFCLDADLFGFKDR